MPENAKPQNDKDRIDALLDKFKKGELTIEQTSNELLTLMINISGVTRVEIARAKRDAYLAMLTNKMIKPEFQKQVYSRMKEHEKIL